MTHRVATAHATLKGGIAMLPTGASREPLYVRDGSIASTPGPGVFAVDLRGHRIFPALVNAHDHLAVNAVPPLRQGAPFANSYAWIDAFQRHFEEPAVVEALAIPKAQRMRHGALKNLLAGVTCVAHHDPWHPALDAADFPVALLRDHGWSYTLDGPDFGPPVRESYAGTPPDRPWIIHLAEGTDAVAAAELQRLASLGCLGANTVLVHGVGLTDADVARVIACGAAVVWCPGSNRALLGRTLDPRRLATAGRLAMGSDSRVSGARDLLDELRDAASSGDLPMDALLGLVTADAARILRLDRRGGLAFGAVADLVIVEDREGFAAGSLVGRRRAELRAVVRDGRPCIADPDFAGWFDAAGVDTIAVRLDGRPKLLARSLAEPALVAMEPGLAFEWPQHEAACS